MLFGLFGSNLHALDLGDAPPEVEGTNQDGETLALGPRLSDGYGLAFFFPKAETPGCIAQACSLRDAYEALAAKGVKVVGVSADDVQAQKHFHENRSLPYPLVADPDMAVIEAFGVPATMGFAKRQAFLFKDGKLVWKDESASTEKQAADVLAQIERLEAEQGH